MSSASASLKVIFHLRQAYDFSGAYAISFMWYGAGKGEYVDFRLETPTGNLITRFPDGDPSWRQVYLPMNQFNRTGTGGSNASMNNVTGIFWTVLSPGLRRMDLLMLHEEPTLRCWFEVRRSASEEVKGVFYVYHTGSDVLKAKLEVG